MTAKDGIRGLLPILAIGSLAVLLQGMVLWRFFPGDALEGMRGALVGAVVVGCNLLLACWRRPTSSRDSVVVLLSLAATVAWLAFTLARSDMRGYGLWKIQGFVLFAVVPSAAIVWNLTGRPWLIRRLFLFMLVLSFVPLSLPLILVERMGTGPLRWLLMTLDIDVIALGRTLGVGALLCVSGITRGRRVLSSILVMAAATMVAAQVVMGERGPVLALLIGLAVYAFPWLRGRRSSHLPPIWVTVTGAVVALVLLVTLAAMFQSRAELGHEERRFEIVAEGWDQWKESPLLGVGLGRFTWDPGESTDRQFLHNVIGEVVVELGLVGLMVFTLYFIMANRLSRVTCDSHLVAGNIQTSSALFAFSLTAAMVSGDLTTNSMVWVSQALLFASRIGGSST